MRQMNVRAFIANIALSLAIALITAAAAAQVSNPNVVGPIPQNAPPGDPSHDYIYFTPDFDLAD